MLEITKDRLWRGSRITNRLSRLKHLRGHGVHSPYVYSIVRNVFMGNALHADAIGIKKQISASNARKYTTIELSNLAAHCKFDHVSLDCNAGKDLIICSEKCSDKVIYDLATAASQNGTAIVILSPYKRRDICEKILAENHSTSIDRLSYIILFNNHLPKQHFKL